MRTHALAWMLPVAVLPVRGRGRRARLACSRSGDEIEPTFDADDLPGVPASALSQVQVTGSSAGPHVGESCPTQTPRAQALCPPSRWRPPRPSRSAHRSTCSARTTTRSAFRSPTRLGCCLTASCRWCHPAEMGCSDSARGRRAHAGGIPACRGGEDCVPCPNRGRLPRVHPMLAQSRDTLLRLWHKQLD